ncbi:hypothetical protein B296_00047924 [Ensete ventricosum]|uniref:Uncharacterized protein n=1 Tax=Ensete ventricosum TaxID=4639 RepID=A0A426XGC0_ENSVE|nr:hypothetical protein B296_00047924 [Ensete ventricosum]
MWATSLLQYLTRCQPPTIRGTIGWSAYRIGSAMPPAVDCQGHYSLVGSTRLLCHATSRLLSGALFAGQLDTFALPCHQSPAVRGSAGWPQDFQLTLPRLGRRPTWLNHDMAKVGLWCSGVGGSTTIGPIILSPCRNLFRHVSTRHTYRGL